MGQGAGRQSAEEGQHRQEENKVFDWGRCNNRGLLVFKQFNLLTLMACKVVYMFKGKHKHCIFLSKDDWKTVIRGYKYTFSSSDWWSVCTWLADSKA